MSNAILPSRVCIIDDDVDFTNFMAEYIEGRGMDASYFYSAEDFLKSDNAEAFDFFIVDLGLPGLDGVDLISLIRPRNPAGILVISGRLGPDAFISALAAGADMILNKPVRFDQVYHAIQSIVRRINAPLARREKAPLWRLNTAAQTLKSPAGEEIYLTPVEVGLIERLIDAGLAPVSRAALTEAAGISGEATQRNLDATVFRLRRKIEQQTFAAPPLRTAHGVGYQLTEAIEKVSAEDG